MAEMTTLGLLVVSVVANIVLGTRLYERSKVTSGDYSVYETFKTSLNSAAKAVDKASQDTGEQKTQDLTLAHTNMEKAIGILMGLRPEADKHGLDFGPTIRALLKSELPIPQSTSSSREDNDVQQTQNTLHEIQAELQGTTYQNGRELSQLRAAVETLNNKLWG